MIKVITAKQAQQMVASDANSKIVDVRESDEFNQEHIDGAVSVPLSDLVNKSNELLKDKDQNLLLYCRSGRRSALAASLLSSLGYSRIYDFGGMDDWVN